MSGNNIHDYMNLFQNQSLLVKLPKSFLFYLSITTTQYHFDENGLSPVGKKLEEIILIKSQPFISFNEKSTVNITST
jgi:hypothetical protein